MHLHFSYSDFFFYFFFNFFIFYFLSGSNLIIIRLFWVMLYHIRIVLSYYGDGIMGSSISPYSQGHNANIIFFSFNNNNNYYL